MRARSFLAVALILVVLTLFVIPKQADAADKMLYWNNGGGIFRTKLDGTDTQQILATGGESWGLAIDSSAEKIYWTEVYGTTGKICRSNLDGSHVEDVLTSTSGPYKIALDVSAGKIYWSGDYGVKCANLDGSNVRYIYDGPAVYIALDSLNSKIYWMAYNNDNGGSNSICRSNLDGSQTEDLIYLNIPDIRDFALDAANDKMYWAKGLASNIEWANTDGSNRQSIFVGDLVEVTCLALDTDAGKMYWSRVDFLSISNIGIQRANLDGSGIENLTSGDIATSIAIGPVPEPTTLLLLGLGALILRKRT
jgi:hypothetical protein